MNDPADYMRDPEEVAKEKNLQVIYPEKTELFVDIDDRASLYQFYSFLPNVEKTIGTIRITKTPSPSGHDGRFHITVELRRPVKDAFERIMLQALLGSDRLHESLSWVRAVAGHAHPTCFFEKIPAQLTAKAQEAA